MQIVRKGCGEKVKDGETLEILCRFSEYNIKENKLVTRNDIVYFYDASYGNYSSLPDKMMVERIGNTYTGSFVYGLMSYTHSSTSVPAGWLVPLTYVKIGRPVNDDDEIAKVRLIVPHSQGTVDASSSVFPCYYEITYERDK